MAIGNKNAVKHGKSSSGSYRSWISMIMRCTNPNDKDFEKYSKYGFDERWRKFENFYFDMGDRPQNCSIDRIDTNKGYSKENCRWATVSEQNRNKTTSVVLEIFGEKMSILEASIKFGINKSTLENRIFRSKWSHEDAVSKPIKIGGFHRWNKGR